MVTAQRTRAYSALRTPLPVGVITRKVLASHERSVRENLPLNYPNILKHSYFLKRISQGIGRFSPCEANRLFATAFSGRFSSPLPGSAGRRSLSRWVIPHHTKEAVQVRKKNTPTDGSGRQEPSPQQQRSLLGVSAFPSPLLCAAAVPGADGAHPRSRHRAHGFSRETLLMQVTNLLPGPVSGC